MKRYGWDGDPDANGEFYLVRDVGDIEDRLEIAEREVKRLAEQLVAANQTHEEMAYAARVRAHKHFGYVDPDEAGVFLGKDGDEIVVSRHRNGKRIMPLNFLRGPKRFKSTKLPQIGWRVYVGDQKGRVKAYSKNVDNGLIVKLDSGERVETINWKLVK